MLTQTDLKDLDKAKCFLESKSLAVKLFEVIGKPIEFGLENLPPGLKDIITEASYKAIEKAAKLAIITLDKDHKGKPLKRFHKGLVTIAGALGGFFGAPALLVELPITTTIMLRSIADIARSEGEDLSSPEAGLACVEVFAFGGKETSQEGAGIAGYISTRRCLEKEIARALEYVADRGISSEGAPILVRFIVEVAERFGIQVTEKVAAQMIPAIGAAGGASVNLVFMDHYQNIAQGHFIIRRLERKYGKEVVERALLSLSSHASMEARA